MTARCACVGAAAACALLLGGCFLDDGCPDEPPPPVQKAATDLDRDGNEAGFDCDDEDPSRHPGARDIPDDGIDQDCSGADHTVHDEAGACQRMRPALFGANPGDSSVVLAPVPPSCGAAALSSVVYMLTSEVPSRVTLSVQSDTPHTVHARAICFNAAEERGCSDAAAFPVMLDLTPDVPVYVVVSATEEPGPFVLNASRVSLIP
ncbi:MAG: putative metal-binding motif-containing protein [Polyangiaceae bacterium]